MRVLLLAMLSTALTGCFLWTTRGEGDRLLEEGAATQARLDRLEDGTEAEREKARAQMTQLEDVLERATGVVTRNNADLGLEVRTLQQQIQVLEGQLAELRNSYAQAQQAHEGYRAQTERQLQRLSQKVGLDVELTEEDIPESADAHFAAARTAYEGEAHSRARALYRAFIEKHPQDSRVDDSVYWSGMTLLQQDRPATALGEFRRVLSAHASGDMVDDALLAMADAFYKLNACDDAKDALNALIRGHRRSPLVNRARRKLQTVQRAPRGYCRD